MLNCTEVVGKVRQEFTGLTSLTVDGVTGFSRDEGKFVVCLDALERRAIPDSMDVIGMYEVRLDDEGHVLSFERKRLRKRSDTREN
jgi:hypothetical protein